MIASDIAKKLSANLPLHTSGFSNTVAISAISVAGTIATVTTVSAHNLANGTEVAISGVDAPVQIDTGSFLRTASVATFETLQDHDLTLSQRDIANGGKTITLSGANEAEFNGTFSLIKVINRRKLQIAVADSGPTTISGSPLVNNANGNFFNGLFAVDNVAATTFTYNLPTTYPLDPVVSNAVVQISIRIVTVLNIDQYLIDVYTKKAIGEDTLVVQLGDVVQSKKRNEESDADASTIGEYSFAPLLIQSFSLYIVMNVTDLTTGAKARDDKVEKEYLPAIFKSVLREKFDTGFTYSQYRTTFTSHGLYAYSDDRSQGKALYVHQISFEQLTQLTKIDMVQPVDDVAMRDINYSLTTDLGTGELTADIDLDLEPIP